MTRSDLNAHWLV